MTLSRFALTFLVLLSPSVVAQQEADPAAVVAEIRQAAQELLNELNDEQKQSLLFKFQDEDQRHNWSNLPTGIVQRKGLRWGDLSESQQAAVMKLMSATLSPEGVQQVIDNMDGDELLNEGGSGGGQRRIIFGRAEYYLSILGDPTSNAPWMWQFGGHHLGINATIVGDQVTLAPSLTGGQPVDFERDGKKVRQLAGEEDTALELIASLTKEQRAEAILDSTHTDMIWGPGREGAMPKDEGIQAAKLNAQQKALLVKLIEERMGILNSVHAAAAMKQIEKDLDDTWFAWFGPTEAGSAFAFRIQAPRLLMEYSPQRLGGDLTQHTHAMYRDPLNDYGVDWVRSAGN